MKFAEGLGVCVVERPRQVAPPLLLPQRPDDHAGRPVLVSVTMHGLFSSISTTKQAGSSTIKRLSDWMQIKILAFNTDPILILVHIEDDSQAKLKPWLVCVSSLMESTVCSFFKYPTITQNKKFLKCVFTYNTF